jgi:hypothetical protein
MDARPRVPFRCRTSIPSLPPPRRPGAVPGQNPDRHQLLQVAKLSGRAPPAPAGKCSSSPSAASTRTNQQTLAPARTAGAALGGLPTATLLGVRTGDHLHALRFRRTFQPASGAGTTPGATTTSSSAAPCGSGTFTAATRSRAGPDDAERQTLDSHDLGGTVRRNTCALVQRDEAAIFPNSPASLPQTWAPSPGHAFPLSRCQGWLGRIHKWAAPEPRGAHPLHNRPAHAIEGGRQRFEVGMFVADLDGRGSIPLFVLGFLIRISSRSGTAAAASGDRPGSLDGQAAPAEPPRRVAAPCHALPNPTGGEGGLRLAEIRAAGFKRGRCTNSADPPDTARPGAPSSAPVPSRSTRTCAHRRGKSPCPRGL